MTEQEKTRCVQIVDSQVLEYQITSWPDYSSGTDTKRRLNVEVSVSVKKE